MNWYCFRTHNKKEKLAVANVKTQLGVEAFCPMISRLKKTKMGKRRFTESMFPCYAFARISKSEHFISLKGIQGVSYLLHIGNEMQPISNEFIDHLLSTLNSDGIFCVEPETLQVKQFIRVDQGPFHGEIGKILSISNGDMRVSVLLDVLGRTVPVRLKLRDVSAV